MIDLSKLTELDKTILVQQIEQELLMFRLRKKEHYAEEMVSLYKLAQNPNNDKDAFPIEFLALLREETILTTVYVFKYLCERTIMPSDAFIAPGSPTPQ